MGKSEELKGIRRRMGGFAFLTVVLNADTCRVHEEDWHKEDSVQLISRQDHVYRNSPET